MYNVRFKPFIGENYDKQEFKMLVLGESHYLSNSDILEYENNNKNTETITTSVLLRFLNYKTGKKCFEIWMNTFTKFCNVLEGRKTSKIETFNFWKNCSFYNYVQTPMIGPRISPSKEEFKKSLNAFLIVLDEVKPDIIFIWGYRLWNNLPREQFFEKIKINNNEIQLFHKIPLKVLPHPSSSKFNYNLSNIISKYIIEVKNYKKQQVLYYPTPNN
jgi:hypothetical protein